MDLMYVQHRHSNEEGTIMHEESTGEELTRMQLHVPTAYLDGTKQSGTEDVMYGQHRHSNEEGIMTYEEPTEEELTSTQWVFH